MNDECTRCNYRVWDAKAKRPWCLLLLRHLIGHGRPMDCPSKEHTELTTAIGKEGK